MLNSGVKFYQNNDANCNKITKKLALYTMRPSDNWMKTPNCLKFVTKICVGGFFFAQFELRRDYSYLLQIVKYSE